MDQIITAGPSKVLLNPRDRVQIIGANLSQLDHNLCLMVDVLNVSNVEATNFVFSVKFYDEFSKALFDGTVFTFSAEDSLAKPHQVCYFEPFILDERFHTARQLEIGIQSVVFSDKTGSVYQPLEQDLYQLPMISLERLQEMKDFIAPDCMTYGENLKTAWRCVCGATNLRAEFECSNCHRNKYYVLNNLTQDLVDQKIAASLNPSPEEKAPAPVETPESPSLTPPSIQLMEKIRGQTLNSLNEGSKMDILVLGLVLVLSILLIFLGYQQFKTTDIYKNHQLSQADRLIEKDDFPGAKKIYLGLSANPPEDLASRQEKLNDLMESKVHYEMGLASLDLKDPFISLNHFTKVLPEDDSRYAKAHEEIALLEGTIVNQARGYLEENRVDEALDLLHRLLNVLPNSAEGLNLLDQIIKSDQISKSQRKRLNEIKIKEKAEEKSKQALTSEDKKRAALSDKALELLHSFQVVKEDKANLRKSPSLDAPILASIPKNSDVYVYETVIEKTSRIWCHVEVETPQGDMVQGWISSHTLEGPKSK